jgi:hypothetical protein
VGILEDFTNPLDVSATAGHEFQHLHVDLSDILIAGVFKHQEQSLTLHVIVVLTLTRGLKRRSSRATVCFFCLLHPWLQVGAVAPQMFAHIAFQDDGIAPQATSSSVPIGLPIAPVFFATAPFVDGLIMLHDLLATVPAPLHHIYSCFLTSPFQEFELGACHHLFHALFFLLFLNLSNYLIINLALLIYYKLFQHFLNYGRSQCHLFLVPQFAS